MFDLCFHFITEGLMKKLDHNLYGKQIRHMGYNCIWKLIWGHVFNPSTMLNKDFYNLESLYYVGLSQYLHFDKSKNKLNVTGPQNLAFFFKMHVSTKLGFKKAFSSEHFYWVLTWRNGPFPISRRNCWSPDIRHLPDAKKGEMYNLDYNNRNFLHTAKPHLITTSE